MTPRFWSADVLDDKYFDEWLEDEEQTTSNANEDEFETLESELTPDVPVNASDNPFV